MSIDVSDGYRIQTVSELTGVATSTLRAWERRYGVPRPKRSQGSYRMYEDSDVATIRRMRKLIESGINTGEAARVAREPGAAAPVLEDRFEPVVSRVLLLARRMDADELQQTVRSSLALGDARTVVARVLVPALQAIDDEWQAGSFTLAHKHLASEIIGATLGELVRQAQPHRPRGVALLGCFGEELHSLPLSVAAFAFASRGVKTYLLGGRTDPAALRAAVSALSPQMVALSVTSEPNPDGLESLLADYRNACIGVPWIVGGAAAPAIGTRVVAYGGIVAGESPQQLTDVIESVQQAPAPAGVAE